MKKYFEVHFWQVLGKVYTPFAEENIFSLALDKKDEYESKAQIAELVKSFVACKCQLGTSPHDVLPPEEKWVQIYGIKMQPGELKSLDYTLKMYNN